MPKLLFIRELLWSIGFFLFVSGVKANVEVPNEKIGLFTGRVSKINKKISMIQIRVDFSNFRYLNSKNRVVFWEEHNSKRKCDGYVLGRSASHFLLKVMNFKTCTRYFNVSPGGRLFFYSEDLANNIKTGRELISILLKKRMALYGKLDLSKKNVDSYSTKVEAITKRYKILRDKLELEWKREIAALEEDQAVSLRKHKDLELKVAEIDQKLEAYKIEDDNMKQDRWALDSRLYREAKQIRP